MTPMLALITVFIFIYGIVIGSFLNVCIYRIPQKEDIVWESSHCMSCGHRLKWYDLVPLIQLSFLKWKMPLLWFEAVKAVPYRRSTQWNPLCSCILCNRF